MISNEKNIKYGMLLSYLTLFISILISIVYTPFFLKSVGQEQYGLNSFTTSITSWFGVISSALVTSYVRFATKEYHEYKAGRRKEFGETNSAYFILFSIIGLLILVFGLIIYFVLRFAILPNSIYRNNDSSKTLIMILFIVSTINLSISAFGNIFGLYNNWRQKFVTIKLITLFVNIAQPISTIPFLLLGCNIVTVAIIQLVFTVIGIILNLFFAFFKYGYSTKKPLLSISRSIFKEIIIFCSFILLNSIVDQINTSADKTILGLMVDDNAKSVAIYQAGMLFKNYLATLSLSISTTFVPKISEAVISGDNERTNRIFLYVSRFQIIIVLFIVGGFATFGKPFMILWLGEEYVNSYYVALVLFVLSSVPYTENISIEVQRSMNKHKFRAILYILIALINIGLTILLVSVMPKNSAIFACLIGTAISSILGHWVIINIYNYKVIKLNITKYVLMFLRVTLFALTAFAFAKLTVFLCDISDNIILLLFELLLYVSIFAIFISIFEMKFLRFFLRKGSIESL